MIDFTGASNGGMNAEARWMNRKFGSRIVKYLNRCFRRGTGQNLLLYGGILVWKLRATIGKWEMVAAATEVDPETERKEIVVINHQDKNRGGKTSWKRKWV
jgi:phage baseplate assembly protein W